MIACDTGFFVEYLDANERAAGIWEEVRRNRQRLVISVISLYELRRLALKGDIARPQTEAFLQLVPKLCTIIYLDRGNREVLLEQAARIAHGNGMSMADSLIFTSALQAGAEVLYTTDRDMARYQGKLGPEIVML